MLNDFANQGKEHGRTLFSAKAALGEIKADEVFSSETTCHQCFFCDHLTTADIHYDKILQDVS